MLTFYLLTFIFISSICSTSNNYQNSKNNDIVCRLRARAKTTPLERKTHQIYSYLLYLSIDKYHDLDLDKHPRRSSLPRPLSAISLTFPVNLKFYPSNYCCYTRRLRSPSCFSSLDLACLDLSIRASRKP